MASMTANWVNRASCSSSFKPTNSLQGNAYHYIDSLIPPQHKKHSYASVYVHNTDNVEKVMIRESNVSQQLNQRFLIDLGTVSTQTNSHAPKFQTLHEYAVRDAPDDYEMFIYADKRPENDRARNYNARKSLEVAAIIVRTKDGEVGTKDILLGKKLPSTNMVIMR